ncbi:hypothetical protein F5880DRAFT_1509135 [Lentinula raphanica]|nr:hypothetical protein F5880DRAFT_1509135 [Lentinula raphanica]
MDAKWRREREGDKCRTPVDSYELLAVRVSVDQLDNSEARNTGTGLEPDWIISRKPIAREMDNYTLLYPYHRRPLMITAFGNRSDSLFFETELCISSFSRYAFEALFATREKFSRIPSGKFWMTSESSAKEFSRIFTACHTLVSCKYYELLSRRDGKSWKIVSFTNTTKICGYFQIASFFGPFPVGTFLNGSENIFLRRERALNTSIFHTVLCLGAILHAACGSPMPPSTQTGDDAPPSYDTLGGAPALLITSSAERFLPYDEVVGRSSHSDTAESCPWEFNTLERNPEFAALIDNHIEVGLTMFGSRELGSFIPGFHTHPDRHHIRFDYPGPRPLPIVNNRVTPSMQTLWCYVDFGPDQTSGTRPFRGVGLLQVYLMDGKPNFESSSMRLELEGHPEVQKMEIGPEKYLGPREPRDTPQKLRLLRLPRDSQRFPKIFKATQNKPFRFVNPNHNDHSGEGLVVEENAPPRRNDGRRPGGHRTGTGTSSMRGRRWTDMVIGRYH